MTYVKLVAQSVPPSFLSYRDTDLRFPPNQGQVDGKATGPPGPTDREKTAF